MQEADFWVSVPQVYSVKKWKISEKAGNGAGLPTSIIRGIARTIFTTLEQAGIGREDVLFSGYNHNSTAPKNLAWNLGGSIKSNLMELAATANRLQNEGYFDDHPGERADYQTKIEELKLRLLAVDGVYTYFFNDHNHLLVPSETKNSIEFATASDGAVICVYDRAKLDALDAENQMTYGFSTKYCDTTQYNYDLTPDQLKTTKVLEFYPRYIH